MAKGVDGGMLGVGGGEGVLLCSGNVNTRVLSSIYYPQSIARLFDLCGPRRAVLARQWHPAADAPPSSSSITPME